MKPIVYLYHVDYADDLEAATEFFENVIQQGEYNSFKATQVEKNGKRVYRLEWYTPERADE